MTASTASASVAALLVGRKGSHSGGGHQRRAVVGVRQSRVGAELDQQPASAGCRRSSRPGGTASHRPGSRTPRPEAPRLSRAFTSAPCSTSFSTNWRLVRFPDPMGGGSPLSSSPLLGLRTQVSVCSAVKPRALVVGIGAGLEQGHGELEMTVLHRQDERRGPSQREPCRRTSWVAWPR